MDFDNSEEIRQLLDRYRDIRYSTEKRDVANAISIPDEFASILSDFVNRWKDCSNQIKLIVKGINAYHVFGPQLSSAISTIASHVSDLVQILEELRRVIGPITFEDVHEEIDRAAREKVMSIKQKNIVDIG